jgi:hypothetical protein
VRNAAGVFHYPESIYVNKALKYASQNADRTVTLDYTTPDPDAYFPSSYSYAIVPTSGLDAGKGKDLATFLNYAVLKGQEKADALGYAPLSKEIVDISLNEIVKIPGAPPKPSATSFADGSAQGSGGGTSGGGTSGGGTSGGGTSGGGTSGGGTSGGGTSGGATSGGATSGGATSGGATSARTATGGATTGGGSVTGTGATGTTGASGTSGAVAGNATRSAGGTGPVTQVAGVAVSRNGGVTPGALGAVAQAPSSSPNNAEVLVTLLQGAALCGAAAAIVYRWQRSRAAA